jgi:hypothetical protein
MERSRGGAWLYVLSGNGELLLVDTRSPTVIAAPDPAGAGATDLAVHPNRSEVYINSGGADVLVQDGAGAGSIKSVRLSSGPTGNIEQLVVTHAGDRVYGWDRSNGELREWDPATGMITTAATITRDVWEMGVSADDSFLVLVGTDTWQGQELGDPENPVHVAVYRRHDRRLFEAAIVPRDLPPGAKLTGGIPVGIAPDPINRSLFWVACLWTAETPPGTFAPKDIVQPVLFTSEISTPQQPVINAPSIRAIDTNDQGDLYLLYDDRIDLYPRSHGAIQTVRTMNDDRNRLLLEVVPALAPPADGITSRMRSRWDALLEAAADRGYRLPRKLHAGLVKCSSCDEKDMKRNREEALGYLAKAGRDRALDAAEIAEFLVEARRRDATVAAQLFIDERLVAPRTGK